MKLIENRVVRGTVIEILGVTVPTETNSTYQYGDQF